MADASFEGFAPGGAAGCLKVDVIAASGNATIEALMQATKTIPIVMISSGDPVGAGFVSSLARPGGNVTGFANLARGAERQVAGAPHPKRARDQCGWVS